MTTVQITSITLSHQTVMIENYNFSYTCIGSGIFTTIQNNVPVNPDGTLVTPLSFQYDDEVCTTGITVKVDSTCGNTYQENIAFVP